MTTLRTRRLIRECVKEMILAEDDGGGWGGEMAGGASMGDIGMGMGMNFASRSELYDAFIKPFTNVIDTALGKTKELSTRAVTLLKVSLQAIATTLIPVIKADYDDIFAKEKDAIGKIRSDYADVYKETWDAFKNSDLLVAAFAYRPDLFLTAAFAKKAPQAAAKLLSVLSGGVLDKVLKKLLKGTKRLPTEAVLRELDSEGQVNDPTPLEKLVNNSKVKEMLAQSPKVQQLTQLGQSVVQQSLRDVFGHAQNVLSAKSLEDMQRKIGKKIPGLEKLAQVPETERAAAEQKLLQGVKAGTKEIYLKGLEGQAKAAVAAGVPKDHPYVTDILKVISKIKLL